jgi:hypothetical protein
LKKNLYITMLLVISIFFVACGAKSPTTDDNAATKDIKITYTTKLAYLPSYNGVEPTEFVAATKKAPLATMRYTLKDITDTKVYEYYENVLKKDGWTITKSAKYNSIFSEKDEHIANIIVQKSGKDVLLVVTSK